MNSVLQMEKLKRSEGSPVWTHLPWFGARDQPWCCSAVRAARFFCPSPSTPQSWSQRFLSYSEEPLVSLLPLRPSVSSSANWRAWTGLSSGLSITPWFLAPYRFVIILFTCFLVCFPPRLWVNSGGQPPTLSVHHYLPRAWHCALHLVGPWQIFVDE